MVTMKTSQNWVVVMATSFDHNIHILKGDTKCMIYFSPPPVAVSPLSSYLVAFGEDHTALITCTSLPDIIVRLMSSAPVIRPSLV